VPRDYSYSLPRKMQLGALRSALSAKLQDGDLKIISGFQLTDHKTKSFSQTLRKLDATKKVLLVETAENRNLELSARNIAGVEMLYGPEVHPYHLLRYDRVIFSKPALEKLQESLKASAPKRKAEVA
jgi:large subunit ribosomal protein L4